MARWQNEPFAIDVKAGETKTFCMCGLSNNGPYCDGSHVTTDKTPEVVTFERRTKSFMPVVASNRIIVLIVMVAIRILKKRPGAHLQRQQHPHRPLLNLMSSLFRNWPRTGWRRSGIMARWEPWACRAVNCHNGMIFNL